MIGRRKTWWPISTSYAADRAALKFAEFLTRADLELNFDTVESVAALLAEEMKANLQDIIERDSLPYYGHLINGWGNALFEGVPITSRLDAFVHSGPSGEPIFLQKDPEGEFHPWQSFAYAVMAGMSSHDSFGTAKISLGKLVQNSRFLNVDHTEAHELGHVLFALAHLDRDPDKRPFFLNREELFSADLMDLAVESHQSGSFIVCRKCHLTEGLCAMTSKVASFRAYRNIARYFLEGQLEMLVLLAFILDNVDDYARSHNHGVSNLVRELRDVLILGDYIENHCYYAGHVIELASFAMLLGFPISTLHRNAIVFVVNHLNAVIPELLPHVSFQDCFLHFGHYRRAITIFMELERVKDPKLIGRQAIKRYTVNFDNMSAEECSVRENNAVSSLITNGIYIVGQEFHHRRQTFEAVIASYSASCERDFQPRGKFGHFRRICPPRWPRSLHYEFLDYGGKIGVEIHIESDWMTRFSEDVIRLLPTVASLFPLLPVEWDPHWWGDRGRLRILFDGDTDPNLIAGAMMTLIKVSFIELNDKLCRVCISF